MSYNAKGRIETSRQTQKTEAMIKTLTYEWKDAVKLNMLLKTTRSVALVRSADKAEQLSIQVRLCTIPSNFAELP